VSNCQFWARDICALDIALATLRDFSLFRRQPKTKTLSIHPLVQEVLKASLNEEEHALWAKQVACLISNIFPDMSDPASCSLSQRYLSHALECIKLIDQYSIHSFEAAWLLYQVGISLNAQGSYAQAEALFKKAYALYLHLLGPELLDLAKSLDEPGLIVQRQEKYLQAREICQRMLTLYGDLSEIEPLDSRVW
jgi:tetratricopeptide (TPR) repeat protein